MNVCVSIVIPCYNGEQYVGDAIKSALEQTYSQTEVIVIDDGSTDSSLEVIRSFGDAIRWETGPNRGGCAARNRGVELARGELIQFLDADDVLKGEKLERQVPLVVEGDLTIVYCGYDVELTAEREFVHRAPVYSGEDPVVFALSRSGLQTSGPVHWKKCLVAVGGFREGLACAQERDLHLRLACFGMSFRYLPEALYTLRSRSGSVSSDSINVLDQHSDIAWNAHRLLSERGELTEARAAALAGFLAADARAYLRHGMAEKAESYFEQARRMHPDGGIPQAYSRKTRWLARTIGPAWTHRLAGWGRRLTTAGQ